MVALMMAEIDLAVRSAATGEAWRTAPPPVAVPAGRTAVQTYRRFIESSHDPVLVLTPSEVVLDVNDEACRIYGYPRHVFIGMNMQAISVDTAEGRRQMEKLLRGENVRFTTRQLRSDGVPLSLDIRATSIPYEQGLAVISMNRVVSESRVGWSAGGDEPLDDLLLRVIEPAAEGICLTDAAGRCTIANSVAARILGSTAAELRGKWLCEIVHDAGTHPPQSCPILRASRTGQPVRIDHALEKSGRSVRASISPLLLRGSFRGLFASFVDATELTRKNAMVGSLAHELNNVLMALVPVCDILERRVTDVKIGRLLSGLKSSVERGRQLTERVLRLNETSARGRMQTIDLAPFLGRLAVDLRALLGRSVTVQVHVPDEAIQIFGDAAELTDVFINLASNARDAMPDGGTLTIAVTRERDGIAASDSYRDTVHFQVTDMGTGMSPDVLSRAFEPMFSTREGASGLGLPLVQRIVHDHGGDVSIESEPGRGTCVTVSLPGRRRTGGGPRTIPTRERSANRPLG